MKRDASSKLAIAALAVVVGSGLALVIAAFSSPLDGATGDGLPRFLGRLHPLVLHFPIVLLPLALAVELLRFAPEPWRRWSSASLPILVLAAIAASITATLGVLLAANEGHAGALVERHRLLGIAVAVFAVAALGLHLAARAWPARKALNPVYLAALSIACLVMMPAAHDGGSMVHGQNFLPQYAPAPLKQLLSGSNASDAFDPAEIPSTRDGELLKSFSGHVAPILDRNCSKCHGDSKQEGGIRFDRLSPVMSVDRDVEAWSSVRDALNAHQMPPEDEGRQPTAAERQQVVGWIDSAFEHVAEQRRANRASPMRRLTVNEYENTLQELFGTEFKFGENLPSAPISEHGYSRDAALVSVSALELEYFLNIARESVDSYVIFGGPVPKSEHYVIEFEDVVYRPGVSGDYTVDEPMTAEELQQKQRARSAGPVTYSDRTLFPLPEGPIDLSTEDLNRSDRQKTNGQYARFKSTQPHRAGELIARVHVAAKLGDDGSAPRLQFSAGRTVGTGIAAPSAGACDVTASLDEPQVCEFRVPLRQMPVEFNGEDTTLSLFAFNMSRDRDAQFKLVPEGYNVHPDKPGLVARHRLREAEAKASIAEMRQAGVNELYLDAVEIDIVPFGEDTSANLFRVDILGAIGNAGADSRMVAENSLKAFMERAYRRTVSRAELESMLSLYDQFQSEGDTFEEALKETLSTVLISAPFLYVAAPVPADVQQDLSEEERSQIASRLSYFLWSGPPDDRLLELASQDRLSDPATLATEVNRMLADERSRRFSRSFAREWLRLDKFDLVAINPEFYPFYDDNLGQDLVAETITTFQEIFHSDRDARDLISSDTVYVNQRLARHYGLPAVTGGAMRPAVVPDYRTRGGLLHQGAILTMTADGAESNPVYRGVWILERLLNDPPPPPPPSVPPLESASPDAGPQTLKQRIAQHREQSACQACHEKIDPWGLALEQFDAIGAARDQALVVNPDTGANSYLPIDSSTILNTGEEIRDSSDLVSFLSAEREEEITRSLTWHMMTYALGRAPNIGDEQELESIHQHFRISGYKLSALALAIVQSEAFQAEPAHAKPTQEETLQATMQPAGHPE